VELPSVEARHGVWLVKAGSDPGSRARSAVELFLRGSPPSWIGAGGGMGSMAGARCQHGRIFSFSVHGASCPPGCGVALSGAVCGYARAIVDTMALE